MYEVNSKIRSLRIRSQERLKELNKQTIKGEQTKGGTLGNLSTT